jgi:peptidyl-prolyl cis-trans isomerase SurA
VAPPRLIPEQNQRRMRTTRTTCTILVAAVFAAAAAPLGAQQAPRTDRIGHIVAVVGDSAILNFDIQQALVTREAQRQEPIPAEGPARAVAISEILEERIGELLLLQAALRDTTIRVGDEQVSRAVQAEVEQRQRALGGAAELEQALRASGLTMQAFRDMLTQQERKRLLIGQYVNRNLAARKPPPVTDRELREAFEARRDQLDQRPATVTFQQVVVRTEPSPEALARTRARADSVFERVRAREDFELLARRHGEDDTRERGGDLGWGRRSDWVREFANVAFSLRPGEVSAPVRTQFGYHLIKVERTRGAEVHARHILFRHEMSVADAARARARADSVAEQMRAGGDATALARQYGDRDEPVRIGPFTLEQAQGLIGVDLANIAIGQVLGPIALGGENIAEQFVVVRVVDREPAREWSIDDQQLRDRLRQDVQQQKLFAEIVAELRRSTHVEIRGT